MLIVTIFRAILFAVSAHFIANTTSAVSDGFSQCLIYFAIFATAYAATATLAVYVIVVPTHVFSGILELLFELGACVWGFGILQYIDGLDKSDLECKGATQNFSLMKLFAIFNIAFSALIIGGAGGILGGIFGGDGKIKKNFCK